MENFLEMLRIFYGPSLVIYVRWSLSTIIDTFDLIRSLTLLFIFYSFLIRAEVLCGPPETQLDFEIQAFLNRAWNSGPGSAGQDKARRPRNPEKRPEHSVSLPTTCWDTQMKG